MLISVRYLLSNIHNPYVQVHKLLKSGEHAFKSKSFQHALRCYNEALEIDELSVESLAGNVSLKAPVIHVSYLMCIVVCVSGV